MARKIVDVFSLLTQREDMMSCARVFSKEKRREMVYIKLNCFVDLSTSKPKQAQIEISFYQTRRKMHMLETLGVEEHRFGCA